jgi:oxalate decarboxylase
VQQMRVWPERWPCSVRQSARLDQVVGVGSCKGAADLRRPVPVRTGPFQTPVSRAGNIRLGLPLVRDRPIMPSPYLFRLECAELEESAPGRAYRLASGENFPILSGMSLGTLELDPAHRHGPRWNTNAHLIAYCSEGAAIVTIVSPGSLRDEFRISAGELFFVERGFLCAIENNTRRRARFVVTFSHRRPEAFDLSGAADPAVSPPRMAARMVDRVRSSPHKLAFRSVEPDAATAGMSLTTIGVQQMTILERLSARLLSLAPQGDWQPHWHPNCAELGYMIEGKARVSVMNPAAAVETFEARQGDIYFIPLAYPHWLENIGDREARCIISFGDEDPLDINLSGSLVPALLDRR